MGFEIEGKVALVTGANRGIGKAITEKLIQEGVSKVYGAVRDPNSLNELVQLYPEKVVPLQLDLTNAELIEKAAETASDVDLLVNNAGVLRNATALSDSAIDDLKFEMETNVYGFMKLAQVFAPVLKANGGGALVQLNSVVSIKSFPDFTTYCASKAAAYSVTQALRALLAPQGTQVVSVHPGPIATDMGDAAGLTEVAESPELVANELVDSLRNDHFHAYCGAMAKQVGQVYESFATNIVEADMSEA